MVPNYLLSIVDQVVSKKDSTTFHIKCKCGADTFLLAKNVNMENKRDNTFDNYWNSFKCPIFSLQDAVDKNGERYVYGTTFFGIRVGKFYYKDLPHFNERKTVKAKCSQCKAEFVIFDNLHYGYNAIAENERQSEPSEPVKYIWSKKPKEVVVVVRNSLSLDEFAEEFGRDSEKYSNAFESIEIYTVDNGKKRTFFEEETA